MVGKVTGSLAESDGSLLLGFMKYMDACRCGSGGRL